MESVFILITVIRKFPITATRYITQNESWSNTALTPGQESRWVLVQRAFRLSHWIWNMTIMIWLVDLRSGMVLSSSSSMVCHLLIPVKKWWIKEKKKFIYFSWTYFRLGLYFLVAQSLKSLPTMWETWVRSWVGKIPWRRAWQPTPVFLPGRIPMDKGAWWATVHGVTKTQLSD